MRNDGAGLHFGSYRTDKLLATGGMAEVYLARSRAVDGFQKRLVLKRILPHLASNAFFVEMFLDEARLAAQLAHPNIGQIFDLGLTDGRPYYTMEYIDGPDVLSVLRALGERQERMPMGEAIAIVVGAATGLHHAHERRSSSGTALDVVHRDVSPSNILVSYAGDVKVIDFGVAKANEQQNETRVGMLKGKFSYMSPEQCRGAKIDRRSDVFSLGVVLFELTTSTRLFRGVSDLDTMNKILTQPVSRPSDRRRDYPKMLESIVLKALAKNPDERYSTAEEFRDALLAFARMHELDLSPLKLASFVKRTLPRASGESDLSEQAPTTIRTPPPVEPSVIVEPNLSMAAPLPERERTGVPIGDPTPRVLEPRRAIPSARASRRVLWASTGAGLGVVIAALVVFMMTHLPVAAPPAQSSPSVLAVSMPAAVKPTVPAWMLQPTERLAKKARRRR